MSPVALQRCDHALRDPTCHNRADRIRVEAANVLSHHATHAQAAGRPGVESEVLALDVCALLQAAARWEVTERRCPAVRCV